MSLIVKVLDNFTAVDHTGKDHTDSIPLPQRKKAFKKGNALKSVSVNTGVHKWEEVPMSEYESLLNANVQETMSNVTDTNIIEFLKTTDSFKPENLIMNNLKWKYLMRSVLRGKNIMMTGPSGCGKTLAAQSVAKVLANEPITVEISQSELNELRSRSEVEIMSVEKL